MQELFVWLSIFNNYIKGKERPKITWKDIMKKESSKVGLNKDARNRKKWKEGVSSWCESQ